MIMSSKYQLISLKFLGILDFIKKKKRKMYIVVKKKKFSRRDLGGSVVLGGNRVDL